MLRVDLGLLDRDGSVDVEANVSAHDELWDGTDLDWSDDVEVRLRASSAGTGEIVVRGRIVGTLRQECRRCLDPVRTKVDEEVTMVFVSEPEEMDDGGGYSFEGTDGELNLSEAIREELVLAVNPFVVCNPDCRGLCPRCGQDLNDGSCDCAEDEADPRWAALRQLKSE